MLELSPFQALIFSLHHSPGTQAILVGSGLSSAAGIPTGWAITLELIRRIAALDGVTEHSDWEQWFTEKFEKRPTYSELLDMLAKTQSERRSILHDFIEKKDGQEDKRPTKAHHSIAQLVASGAVKVIITTNFDRLLETVLREAGIEPTIIASEDDIEGSLPLIHSSCTLIKVHGDYLDTRIRNTDSELEQYPIALNKLLDQVFDNFGLVVVGWSGEWDTALRGAIKRAPTRRYPFYWAARGAVHQSAKDIIISRGGRELKIESADRFFVQLQNGLDALKQISRPHPHSIELALAMAKKYCRDDAFNMEWVEFLQNEVEKVRSYVLDPEYQKSQTDSETLNRIIDNLTTRSEILRRACLICGRWGTEKAHLAVIEVIKSLLLSEQNRNGAIVLIEIRNIAASFCLYWTIAGALSDKKFNLVKNMLHTKIRRENIEEIFATTFPLSCYHISDWKFLRGLDKRKTPPSDYFFELFLRESRDIFIHEDFADELFDRVEFTIGLEFAYRRYLEGRGHDGLIWFPFGRFIWKESAPSSGANLLNQINQLTNEDPYFKAGLFGGDAEKAKPVSEAISNFMNRIARQLLFR